eukprot:289664-Rhodomonas_salina.1
MAVRTSHSRVLYQRGTLLCVGAPPQPGSSIAFLSTGLRVAHAHQCSLRQYQTRRTKAPPPST